MARRADDLSRRLKNAARDRLLVRCITRFQPGRVDGYVLDVGPEFFILAVVSDDIRFNGFECYRIRDMTSVAAPSPYTGFVKTALRKRGLRRPRKPRVKLDSLEALLRSADRAFRLVTIHREGVDHGACWIGHVLDVADGRVSFAEIDPHAKWDPKPGSYRLSEITRVDFGGAYEDALYLVGGEPPASATNDATVARRRRVRVR